MKEYIVLAVNEMSVKRFDELGAPELVRCKDCKNWVGNGADIDELPHWFPCKGEMRQPDWFCANGERRD